MALDLQARLELEVKQALDALDKVQGSLKETAAQGQRTTTEVKHLNRETKSLGSRGVGHVRSFKNWLERSAVAAASMAAATVGVLKAAKELGQISNTRQGLLRLGVTDAQMARIGQHLNGAVDKLTLMNTLQDAVQKGVPVAQFEGLAKTAAVLAKNYGLAKDQALQLVASGNLTDAQLESLGTSAVRIETQLLKAHKGRWGALSEIEKTQERTKAIIEAARKSTQGFTTDTRQSGDATARSLAEIKNMGVELGRIVLPGLSSWLKNVKEGFQDIALLVKRFNNRGGKITKQKKEQKVLDSTLVAINDKNYTLHGRMSKELQRQRRIREAAAKAALEEQKALQEQARDLTRNAYEKQLQTIADMGGAFGGVASAMTDTAEKARIFGSISWGRKGMVAAARIAAEFTGQHNVDLARQLHLRQKQLGISGKSLAVAKLMAGWLQAGAKDAREYLGNERAANAQLKAGLQLLEGHNKLAQIRVEQNNAMKDIQQSMTSAQAELNAALGERARLEKRDTAENRAKLVVLDQTILRLRTTVASYERIGVQRQAILKAAQKHAEIELMMEKVAKRRERAQALRSAQQGVIGAQQGLRAARGGADPARDIAARGFERSQGLRDQISKLKAEADAAVMRLAAGGLNNESQQQLIDQIQNQRSIVALKQRELELVQQTTQAQLQGLSLAGQLQRQFAVSGVELAAATASQMKASFDGLVGGFGDAMASVIAGAIQGDKDIGAAFGKSTLEALGNLAMQWGAFFAIQGAGMLAGLNPLGAAVIAAGVGLTALGGVLKGTAGLIGPQPSTSTPSASSTGFRDRLPGAQPERTQRTTENYIIVTNAIYGPEEEQARRVKRLLQRNKRALGGSPI